MFDGDLIVLDNSLTTIMAKLLFKSKSLFLFNVQIKFISIVLVNRLKL